MNSCGVCKKECPKRTRCSVCRAVVYCSVTCQQKDWKKQHKRQCKRLRDERLTRKMHTRYHLPAKFGKDVAVNDPESVYVIVKVPKGQEQILCDLLNSAHGKLGADDFFVTVWNAIPIGVIKIPKDRERECKESAVKAGTELVHGVPCIFDKKGNPDYFPLNGDNVWTLAA